MFFFSRPPREGARGEGDVAENIQSHLPQLLPPTFASPPPFRSKAAIRFHFLLESHHRARGRKGGEINLVAASSARNLQRRETRRATRTAEVYSNSVPRESSFSLSACVSVTYFSPDQSRPLLLRQRNFWAAAAAPAARRC